MPNHKVKLDIKVKAMRECLHLDTQRVKAIMRKYGLSERSAFRWLDAILDQLPSILEDRKPGPKKQTPDFTVPPRHYPGVKR
jgi:hypothetical protein